MLIWGPSGSGKTTFFENRITKKNDIFDLFDRFIWCYGEESG